MKKIIIASAIVMVAILIYSFIPQTTSSNRPLTDVATTPEEVEKDGEMLELPELDDKALLSGVEENLTQEDMDEVLTEDTVPPQEVEPEMVQEVQDIMVESDMNEIKNKLPLKKGVTPIIGVEIAKNSITQLKVGDTIALPYMGSGEYEAKIESKTTHANGSVSVSGNLLDSGNQYSVVLTEGKNSAFGTVTTPNGSFEIETKDGQGYVYSTDEIDQAWIDHSKGDTLHPEHDHEH